MLEPANRNIRELGLDLEISPARSAAAPLDAAYSMSVEIGSNAVDRARSAGARRRDEAIGYVVCWFDQTLEPDEIARNRTGLEAVADQLALAAERAQFADVEEVLDRVDDLLFDLEPSTGHSDEKPEIALGAILSALTKLEYIDVEAAQLLLAENGHMRIFASTQPEHVGVLVAFDSVSGLALRDRKTIHVADVLQEDKYRGMLGPDIRSELAVPIIIANRPIGVVNVESARPDYFHGSRRTLIERFTKKVSLAVGFAKLRNDVIAMGEQARASAVLAAVGDSTANVIHQLNNSIGAIEYWVGTLEDEIATDSIPIAAKAIQEIRRATTDASNLPDYLRTKITADEDIDIRQLIDQQIGRLVPEGITTDTSRVVDDLPLIVSYSLDLVLENILANAVDAMEGHGKLTVEAATFGDVSGLPSHVLVVIRDTGRGMSPDEVRSVFEPGFTTKLQREHSGLGFGMWWVRTFVKRSGGEIDISSNPGVGTTVTILLPTVSLSR